MIIDLIIGVVAILIGAVVMIGIANRLDDLGVFAGTHSKFE